MKTALTPIKRGITPIAFRIRRADLGESGVWLLVELLYHDNSNPNFPNAERSTYARRGDSIWPAMYDNQAELRNGVQWSLGDLEERPTALL